MIARAGLLNRALLRGHLMAMRTIRLNTAGALALPLLALGCDDTPHRSVPWANQRTQIVDANREAIEVQPIDGDKDCVDYKGECLRPQTKCGNEGADIIVDRDGRLLDFVCYPGEATLTVDQVEAQRGAIAQNQNNTVILIDELDDGVDVQGDVSIDANNVVIYGESAATAVIAGNLTVDGNNALVRGVRIQGDASLIKNNVVMALCVIEGDLVINANNVEVIACDVLGNVTVTGNNVKLLGNRIGGELSVSGSGAACVDNYAVSDANGDRVVDDVELGAPLACD